MSEGRRTQWWKASLMPHFDRYTGPSWRSSFQICCRKQGRKGTNCIDGGATVMSVYTLTAGVYLLERGRSKSPPGVGDVESHINRSFRLVWGTLARREMWRHRPKIKTSVSAVSRRLKPW